MVENPTDQLAGCIKAGDGYQVLVNHLRLGGDPQAAKGKCDAAGDAERFKGGCVERRRPVVLVDRKTCGTAPILDRRIEGYVVADRRIECRDGL